MIKKKLFTLLLIVSVFSCNTKKEAILVEKGVSLELANYRKEVLSIVNGFKHWKT